jgi:hypothetical protein
MGSCRSRFRTLAALVTLAVAVTAVAAGATPQTASPPVEVSTTNPFAACPPDGSGINFPGSEVEPWIDVNPTNAANRIVVYQQDRYSNGGSKGTAAAVTFNGGATWTQVAVPTETRCTGGPFQRASDPWVSFGPDGTAHSMSLVTDPDLPTGGFGDNGMVYSRSTTGGLTWEDPILLVTETDPRFLHDKNSITADPNDADFVYAVWDRVQQAGRAVHAPENPIGLGFKGPIYFTRTTDSGDTWEPARKIYETGANKQTIGNQIVVRPQGELYDFFGDIVNRSRRRGGLGPIFVSFIVSPDRGETWTTPTRVDDQLPMSLFRQSSTVDLEPFPCPDPSQTGACPIRGGDFIPDVAVDPANGRLYAVWMDARFSFFQTGAFRWDSIAYSQSTNGGQTWSPAIQVNATPPGSNQNSQAFTPSVAVGSNGTVTVTYYDFRNNTASPATLDSTHWASHCHPASENCANPASWNEETQVSPTFNIREAPFARGYFLGDYMGLDFGGGGFPTAWGSTLGGGPSSIFSNTLTP